MKNDSLVLVDVFENFIKDSLEEHGMIPFYCVSFCSCTYQCGLKYTDIKIQTLQDKDMVLLLENLLRGGVGSVMGDRFVQSDD